MAADQTGLPPFYGAADWSKNLGVNSRNPFNLPQHPSPFVAHFYPLVNPHRSPQSGSPSNPHLPVPPEAILNSIAAGRADILCNELYKNIFNSTARFDPKQHVKGERFPIPAPLENLRALNGKLDVYSSQLIQRNQIRTFYESLRQRFNPGDRLLQTTSQSGKISQSSRSDLTRKTFNWRNSTPCEHPSRYPALPFGSFANGDVWSQRHTLKRDTSPMTTTSAKKLATPQSTRGLDNEPTASNRPCKSTPLPAKSPRGLEDSAKMKDATITERRSPCSGSPSSIASDETLPNAADRIKRKRRLPSSADTCPVCGITVRGSEIKQHFLHEMSKLEKIPLEVYRNNKRNYACRKSGGGIYKTTESYVQATTSSKKHEEADDEKRSSRKLNRQKTFQKVRSNRIERFNSRVGNRRDSAFVAPGTSNKFNGGWHGSVNAFRERLEGVMCPICNLSLSHLGNHEDLAAHVVACSGVENPDGEVASRTEHEQMAALDVDGDCDSFEEYEWCGETRIRATSLANRALLEGAAGFHVIKHAADDEADQDLDVESDETRDFGSTQFTDSDLLPPNASDDDESSNRDEEISKERQQYIATLSTVSPDVTKDDVAMRRSPSLITQALKMKIQDLESAQQSNRCLICMNAYDSPLVSIQCWHVHCKRCWLRALGVKKLCPQCNMITPASQLRRIYL